MSQSKDSIVITGSDALNKSGGITLSCKPNPFSLDIDTKEIGFGQAVAGLTVYELLKQQDTQVLRNTIAVVEVNGEVVLPQDWNKRVVELDDFVLVRAVPTGGGSGKNPLKFVLTLAIFAAAPYLGAKLAASGLFGGLSASFLGSAVGLLGSLAVNALIPPPKVGGGDVTRSGRDSPTFDINGAKNEIRPFDVFPVMLGTSRIFPPFLSAPYTSLEGNDKFLHLLFLLSEGETDQFNLKIGETDADDFDEVDYNILYYDTGSEKLEHFPGVVEEDVQNVLLTKAGGFSTRVSQPNVEEISVDIELPRGLVRFDDEGEKNARSVSFTVQIKPTSGSDWSADENYKSIAQKDFAAGTGTVANFRTRGQNRYWRAVIYINASTGVITMRGQIDTPINPFSGGGATRLNVPRGHYELARAERLTGAVTVTDTRSATFKNLTQTPATDFLVSNPSGTTIRIAAGDLQIFRQITRKQTEAVRITYTFQTDPDAGSYDVRVRRDSADNDGDTRIFDETRWTVMRSHINAKPINVNDVTVMEMRIKATDQLNGVVDELNMICESKKTVWDSDTQQWIADQSSDNPADVFREVLQGKLLDEPVPDSLIDLTALEQWSEYCEERDFRFSQYRDFESSLYELLQDVCRAGRAQLVKLDGAIWSVVIDKPRTVPAALITPANSFGYEVKRLLRPEVHAIDLTFQNAEQQYKLDTRRVYNDGYDINTATIIEKTDLVGIQWPDHVYKYGRNLFAVARLRANTHYVSQDIEQLALSEGAMVKVTHPVPLYGIGSGRIKSLVVNGANTEQVVIDNTLNFDSDGDWVIRHRKSADGVQKLVPISNSVGSFDTLVLTTPETTVGGMAVGDLISVGLNGSESVELIVRGLEGADDMSAKIELVDHAPNIEDADFGEIPEFMSNLTIPAGLETPVFGEFQSDENMLTQAPDGSLVTRVHVTFSLVSGRPYHKLENLELQYRLNEAENDWTTLPLLSNDVTSTYIENVDDGAEYEFRARYRYFGGASGDWVTKVYTVIGKTSLPPDVENFLVSRQADGTRRYQWDYPNPPRDLLGFIIGFKSGSSHAWEDLEPLFTGTAKIRNLLFGILTQSPYESNELSGGSWTIGIKAVDTSLNESENAAIVELTLGDPRIGNALLFEDIKQNGFAGTKTDCSVDPVTGNLIPDDNATWSSLTTWTAFDLWLSDPVTTMKYLTVEIDLGAVVTVMPVLSVEADGATVTLREQHKDTSGGSYSTLATWSGEITARYFQFEIEITNPTLNGITNATLTIDADVIVEQLLDYDTALDSSPAGTLTIPITQTFSIIQTIDVTLQNVGAGWSWEITDKLASAPKIKIYDETDTLADATVDITIRGL